MRTQTCIIILVGSVPAMNADGPGLAANTSFHKLALGSSACQINALLHDQLPILLRRLAQVEERCATRCTLQNSLGRGVGRSEGLASRMWAIGSHSVKSDVASLCPAQLFGGGGGGQRCHP